MFRLHRAYVIPLALLAIIGLTNSRANADSAVINDFHFSGHAYQSYPYYTVTLDKLDYDYQGDWTGTNYLDVICSWSFTSGGGGGTVFSTTHPSSPVFASGTTQTIHNSGVHYSLVVRVGPAGQSNPVRDEVIFSH